MIKPNKDVLKKHICLTAAGIAMQIVGGACLAAAMLVVVKDLNTQVKQALVEKLSK